MAPVNALSASAIKGDARSPDGLGVDPGPLDLFDPLNLLDDSEGFAQACC